MTTEGADSMALGMTAVQKIDIQLVAKYAFATALLQKHTSPRATIIHSIK